MDLQLSVFLLFILFTAGHSLDCYVCFNQTGSCVGQQTVTTCPAESTQCVSSIVVTKVGGISYTTKAKACAATCQNVSMNLNIFRMTSSCCNTDKCNAQDADTVPPRNKCYYCDRKSCSNTVKCSGTEDCCITATGTSEGQPTVVKGCVSKSVCDATASVRDLESISCCSGNLCNGAQSVTQSVLFLCCSLLSYFLMH
ncbi:hypothetical protein R3I93_014328 [Phoxinus phoxinus]|uniref:UPAR/Ly6 domain-containing protein n=1 Tax=Phoxinus phoxinus TaxID=58324 RepID=A0AAN9CQ39_9TELE